MASAAKSAAARMEKRWATSSKYGEIRNCHRHRCSYYGSRVLESTLISPWETYRMFLSKRSKSPERATARSTKGV